MPNTIISSELLGQSILFARFAAAAYGGNEARAYLDSRKFHREERLDTENGLNTQVLLGTWSEKGDVNDERSTIVIAFRGTNERADWLTNAKLYLKEDARWPGRIHTGFYHAAHSVYKKIKDYIRNNKATQSQLVLCGHSLGGTLAQLTATWLMRESDSPRIDGVFTYGAPRLGDDAFCKAYRSSQLGKKTTLWITAGDIVPTVPPHSLGYRHVSSLQCHLSNNTFTGFKNLDRTAESTELLENIMSASDILTTGNHSMTKSYLPQLLSAKGTCVF